MRVGTIVELRVDCLGNPKGTKGVVFYHYGTGFQAIFKNGNYDGFSLTRKVLESKHIEADYFLEDVGFEPSLANYEFTSVIKVSQDFAKGVFDIVWEKKQ